MRPPWPAAPLKLAPVVLVLAALANCGRPEPPRRAFYYWQTRFQLSTEDAALLTQLAARQVYLRFFDVDWDPDSQQPMPIAPCQIVSVPSELDIVPVVFLRHRVFQHTSPAGVKRLAQNVWTKVSAIARPHHLPIGEIQVDCDWTDSTRDGFFSFTARLREIAAAQGVSLSATLRLHQIKYHRRTGVPPADRVTLMFYNIGRIDQAAERMSIYNRADALRYTRHLSGYPLPLDIALPVFSWTIHSRQGRVINLLSGVSESDLQTTEGFHSPSPGLYRAGPSFFFRGSYILSGDEMRVEAVTPALALEAARLAADALPRQTPRRTVTLFDLNDRRAGVFSPEDYEAIYRCFD